MSQKAVGGIADTAQFVGRNGKVVVARRRPEPRRSASTPAAIKASTRSQLVSGRWPSTPDEVAMDADTANDQHLAVGDSVGVIPEGGAVRRFHDLGHRASSGRLASLGGATLAIFDLPTAQALFDKQGELDQIDVAAKPGSEERCARCRADPSGPAAPYAGADQRVSGKGQGERHRHRA